MMKTKFPTLLILSLGLALCGAGCSTIHDTGALGAGAVIGGVAGKAMGIGGALSGTSNSDAITGAVLGVVLTNEVARNSRTTEDRIRESYLQGQRDARVEAAAEYWNAATYADGTHPNLTKSKAKVRQVQADPAFVEGVKYGAYYSQTP